MQIEYVPEKDQFSRFMDNVFPPDAWMVIGTCLSYLFWGLTAWYAHDIGADYGATIISFLPIAGFLLACYSGLWLLSDQYLEQSSGPISIVCILLLSTVLLFVAPIYYGIIFLVWSIGRY